MYILSLTPACLQGLLEQLLPSVTEEEVLGTARVIQVYRMRGSKRATIGGSLVESGQVLRNATFRVLRGEKVSGGVHTASGQPWSI